MYCGNVWDAVCTQAGNVKVRQYWESQRGALCPQSGQHAVGFLPDGDRAGQTLSEMSRPQKRLFVLSDSSQGRTRSEQACLVVGVCERTQRVCVMKRVRLYAIVPAGVQRDIVDFPFSLFVCLFVYMCWLGLAVNVSMCVQFSFCLFGVCL